MVRSRSYWSSNPNKVITISPVSTNKLLGMRVFASFCCRYLLNGLAHGVVVLCNLRHVIRSVALANGGPMNPKPGIEALCPADTMPVRFPALLVMRDGDLSVNAISNEQRQTKSLSMCAAALARLWPYHPSCSGMQTSSLTRHAHIRYDDHGSRCMFI